MDAFRLIYERYYQDVLRFALFLTGDRVRAGDLAADTFVRAWMARDDIRQETVKSVLADHHTQFASRPAQGESPVC